MIQKHNVCTFQFQSKQEQELYVNPIYDAIIIGAGPAGMFAALEFADSGMDMNVLMLDLGRPYDQRLECPIMDHKLEACPGSGCNGACNVITGFGGAFTQRSGGTLSMYPAGSFLLNYFPSVSTLQTGYEDALKQWRRFLVGNMSLEGSGDEEKIISFANKVAHFGGLYKHWQGWKLSRETLSATTRQMEEFIKSKIQVEHSAKVDGVTNANGIWHLHCGDKVYNARTVLFATGRKGNSIVSQILSDVGVQYSQSSIDLGIRLEIDEGIIDHLAEIHPDLKIKYTINGHQVRTFCFCPGGYMAVFSQDPIDRMSHTRMNFLEGYVDQARRSGRSNMSFLHRLTFTNPSQVWDFQQQFEARYQALGGQIVAQRYTDLGNSVFRPLPAEHTLNASYRMGSVYSVVPEDTVHKILEAMRKFDAMMKHKVLTERAILIAPELGNFWPEVVVNNKFMTTRQGLYMAGDALGFTRGALQACLTGKTAAHSMIEELASK
ncbi:MAG: hypothetical protein U0525_04455 [Patescibacteria group bacterium]